MNVRMLVATGLIVIGMAGPSLAQVSSQTQRVPGAGTSETTTKLTGEAVWIDGPYLLVRLRPTGALTLFKVPPGREFMIDGQKKYLADLKLGTVLTGEIITTTTPVTTRTTDTLTGTVQWVVGPTVVLKHPNGDVKQYQVPDSYQFMVEGKPAAVKDLRPGMKVSATKITETPHTEISSKTVVTGTAPK